MRRQLITLGAVLFLVPVATQADSVPSFEFRLTFAKEALPTPFTGRVFVVVSKGQLRDAPPNLNWLKAEPFFAMDVKDWQPEAPLSFEAKYAFPESLAKLPAGKYHVQAVLDRDLGGQRCFSSPGNLYSKPTPVEFDPTKGATVALAVDQTVAPRKFEEKPRVKLVDIESKILSKFHGKPMRLRAGVALPKSFADNPERKYPVIYEIPGFGGDHTAASFMEGRTDVAGVEMIHVTLDPACRTGHHVFADSANNGPYGRALIEELIPNIEKTWRGIGTPAARFVTGHSSGGWSSLWLQITYPEFFGGVWSTAPDPVDFRDFQMVNIYEPNTNIFTDAKGDKRPLARMQGKVMLYYKPFSDMETVMGRGGQLQSFEAVFSPRGADGQPRQLWDRATGRIDPAVAEAWQKYDIRMIMKKNWPTLAPKLAGKVHVYMGGEDTFYLDGATKLLQASLKKLGSDAVVEIFPGRDHNTLMTSELRKRIAGEMAEQFRKGQP